MTIAIHREHASLDIVLFVHVSVPVECSNSPTRLNVKETDHLDGITASLNFMTNGNLYYFMYHLPSCQLTVSSLTKLDNY